MKQERTAIRLVTGVPRGLVHLGKDGMILKRWLLKDPYAGVAAGDLLRLSLWKLAAVYAALAALGIALWRRREFGAVAALAVMAAVPSLAFAVAWNPGSAERFLPALPVVLMAAAVALHALRPPAPERLAFAAFAAAMLVVKHERARSAGICQLQP
jgi:hypothetical protein